MARLGLYPEAPKTPCVLGYEVVGRIAALGSGVSGWSVGERVVAFTRFGGYSEHAVADARVLARLPDSIEGGLGTALATQYCTAWFAAEEMVQLHEGDRVLIHAAAGGVGTALVQLARRRGCEIHGTTGSASKLEYLRSIGVDHPYAAEAPELHGKKFDVIFDSLGGSSVRKGYKRLDAGGRIVCYGVAELASPRRNPLRALQVLASFGVFHPISLLTSSRGIIGINMLRIADEKPEIIGRCLRAVVELAAEGQLSPRLGAVYPAEKVAEAHEFLGSRRSTGKVALRWK
jgi:NADPH2:quinone reductase